jgi:hypothetical protein
VIAFRNYNVLVPKFRIEDTVDGGLKRFYEQFGAADFQEDAYLIGIGAENATGVRDVFEQLLDMGLAYDEASQSSPDFAVVAKEGMWWPVPWLVRDTSGCWFIADVEAPLENQE